MVLVCVFGAVSPQDEHHDSLMLPWKYGSYIPFFGRGQPTIFRRAA